MAISSEFLCRFNKLKTFSSDQFLLHGDRMILEIVPKEELKTAGGIVIASDLKGYRNETEQNRPLIAIVLAVGKGYYNEETGEEEPHPHKPGEVVVVAQMGLRYFSEFPGLGTTSQKIAITRPSEVHMSWASIEMYEAFKEKISEKA